MLLCTVRGCRLELTREERRMVCPRGHSFDIARSGYINLLQPQDRRSNNPGDAPAAVNARRLLHDRGLTAPLRDAIAEILSATSADTVLDAGCGDGFYLGTQARDSGCKAHGIDISIPAIDAAAKRYPECEWIVANADRFIPYADASFSAVMSITGRMNSAEFRRVLQPTGRLLVAIPGAQDLIELRGAGRDRVNRTINSFAPDFKLHTHRNITTTAALDAQSVHDILLSIYRPKPLDRVEPAQVTLSLDLLLFNPA